MALTNSERQARFKQNAAFKNDGQGLRRVEAWLTTGAVLALERLASHGKTTRRDILERLLLSEQDQITKTLSDAEYELFIAGTGS